MPSFYSPTYYEDQKKEHDFYMNLGNQCRIAEEQRQALKKARIALQEQERRYQMLQGYNKKLDEAKKVLEDNRKLSHALWEYNYTKDKELVLFTDRIAWRDCLSPEEEACYREYLIKLE
jgi:hypothetical protein